MPTKINFFSQLPAVNKDVIFGGHLNASCLVRALVITSGYYYMIKLFLPFSKTSKCSFNPPFPISTLGTFAKIATTNIIFGFFI